MGTDSGVRDVAFAAFDAVVDTDLADRAKGFVIEGGNAKGGAQFLVELAQILQVRRQRRQLLAIIGEQELLIAGVPELGELALVHDGGQYGHVKAAARLLAEFGAATILFDANDAASGAHAETESRQAFDSSLFKVFVNIPHGEDRVRLVQQKCKVGLAD